EEAAQAETAILDFLSLDGPEEASFGQDVRIVVASADFSKPLTATVLWLIDRGIDIRCIRMVPHRLGEDGAGRLLINFEQIIPVPEASDYQVQFARKIQRQREERATSRDLRRFDLRVQGRAYPNLQKNRAVYHLVAALIRDAGVSPEDIAAGTEEGQRRASS